MKSVVFCWCTASRAKMNAVKSMSRLRGQTNHHALYPQPEGLLADCMIKHGRELADSSVYGILWNQIFLNYANIIIFPHLDYHGSLVITEADTLEGRREWLAQRFFQCNVLDEAFYLHYLLRSQERSQDIVNRLRSSQTYELYSVRTESEKIFYFFLC